MVDKVSVIIPVYNGEAFIAQAINSVLNQTVKPFQIIVVNDGSKDSTSSILSTFDNTIKVIDIENGGVSNARNIGILASTGDFIAFLDADDVWHPDKLRFQIDVFHHNREVGFVCCNYLFLDQYTNQKLAHFSIFHNDNRIIFDQPLASSAFDVLIAHNFVGTCSNVIIKSEVVSKVGLFNVAYKQAEDYDYWIRCATVTKFFLQSDILLEKKTHDSNLTGNFLETLMCHEKVMLNLQKNSMTANSVQRVGSAYQGELAKVRYEIGNLLFEKNQKINSFKYFFKGLTTLLSISNFRLFIRYFGRKMIRTLSLGTIRNRKIEF